MYGRQKYCPEINFFVQAQFAGFKKTLDSEMKRLKAGGAGLSKKRVDPISFDDEEKLWEKSVLGCATPQTLLDTMVYMCGANLFDDISKWEKMFKIHRKWP